MPNWLEVRATQDAVFERDGPELWRQVRDAITSTVDGFNNFYCHRDQREFEYNDCIQSNDNCVRVRWIPPPGERDQFVEIRFKPEQREIVKVLSTASAVEETRVTVVFGPGTNDLRLMHEGTVISADEASRILLEAFLFRSGSRRVLNAPNRLS